MLIRSLLLLACLNTLSPVMGQDQNWSFEWVAPDKSFFRASILDIVQDKQGGLWTASSQGLNYYDGINAINYHNEPGNKNSLLSNYVTALDIDGDNLWIGYDNGGLSILNVVTRQIQHLGIEFLKTRVNTIARIDSIVYVGLTVNGAIMLTRDGKQLGTIDLTPLIGKHYTDVLRRSYNSIYRFLPKSDGSVWLATHDGLYTYNPATQELRDIRLTTAVTNRDDLFSCFISDGADGLWLGGWEAGLTHYNPVTKKIKRYRYDHPKDELFNNIISSILLNPENPNELYIGSIDRGVGVFNIAEEKFYFMPSERDIYNRRQPTTQVYKVFSDNAGNTWIGSDLGIAIFHRPDAAIRFNVLPVTSSTNGAYYGVNDVFIDEKNNRLLLATSNADGVNARDLQTGAVTHVSIPIMPTEEMTQHARFMLGIGRDSLLITSRDYLLLLDQKNLKWLNFPQPAITRGGVSVRFMHIAPGANNTLWIGSSRNGFFELNRNTNEYTHYRHLNGDSSSLANDYIRDMAVDTAGNLWLVTYGKGLTRFDARKHTFTQYFVDEDLAALSIHIDNEGKIWLAGENGIKVITVQDGKPQLMQQLNSGIFFEPAYEFAADANGYLYTLTQMGLIRIHERTFQVASIPFDDYFKAIERHNARLKIIDSILYMSTTQGYFTINLNKASFRSPEHPGLVIKSMEILGEPYFVAPGKSVTLKYFQNSFTIQYGVTSLRMADRVTYSYLLEGSDSRWIRTGNRNYITLKDLGPGTYTLRVQASDPLSDWRAEATLLTVHIESPFWRTWWFGMLIVLVVSAAVYVGFRFKVRQVRRAEKLKAETTERIMKSQVKALQAQMNPHFIFNCLNSINYFILESKPLEASEYLAKFSKLIRLFLEELNEEYISLAKELQTLDLYLQLEQLRFGAKLTYTIETDGLDKDSMYVPTMIVQPFVENCVIHGIQPLNRTGHIFIRFYTSHNQLVCVVRDNGVGRKKSASEDFRKRKSFGIGLSSLRLHLIQPQSSIELTDLKDENGLPAGTEVTIRFSYMIRSEMPGDD